MERGRRTMFLPPTGRSSRFGFARHAVMHESECRRAAALGRGAPRARALRMLGRRREALEGFDRILENDPACAQAHAWRWELRLSMGPAALAGIERAAALEPRNAVWRVWLGVGRLAFDQRSHPDLKAARGQVGGAYHAEVRKALADFDAALAKDELCVAAYAASARAFSALGEHRRAAERLDAALRLEPGQAWLYALRAEARLASGDRAGFTADCEDAVLRDEGVACFESILGLWRSSSVAGVAAAAGRFLRRNPGAYWMRVLRSDCRRSPEVRDYRGGLADIERAVEQAPRCAYAWAYLARARTADLKPRLALEALGRAISLAPSCGWFRAWRGEILRRYMDDAAGALAEFDRAEALAPDYELLYAFRGRTLLGLDRGAEALRDLRLAAKLAPDHTWIAGQLCRAERRA